MSDIGYEALSPIPDPFPNGGPFSFPFARYAKGSELWAIETAGGGDAPGSAELAPIAQGVEVKSTFRTVFILLNNR